MPKERPRRTPDAPLRSWLRRIWMKCNEKAYANKREGYCCERCNVKQSRAKGREVYIEVHHKNKEGNIQWDDIIDLIYERVLVHPDNLEILCKACHHEEHHGKGDQRDYQRLQSRDD